MHGVLPRKDGTFYTKPYEHLMEEIIASDDPELLRHFILTVGVVSNHGNWFSKDNMNKELVVLAQSYDWLLFLTDAALAEFIQTTLHGTDPGFAATRSAFELSYSGTAKSTTFTKVTMDLAADQELTRYFAEMKPWERWFNVISPDQPIATLRRDLHRLSGLYGIE